MKTFAILGAVAALCSPIAAFGNSTAPYGNWTVPVNATVPANSTFTPSSTPTLSTPVYHTPSTPSETVCDPSDHHKSGGPPFGPACKTPPGWIKNGRPTAPANGWYREHPRQF